MDVMLTSVCIPVLVATGGIALLSAALAVRLAVSNRRLRTQAQSAAVLLEESMAASRQKTDFLASMSHEIRTPMNGILGLTELALGTELTLVQREYLTSLNDSAANLLGIINEILDCSRIEAGKLQLESVDFPLHRLITDAVRSFSFQAHEKDLELLYSVEPNVPEWVKGDPTRLRQVLINLMGNALKFTRKGEIELRCELSCVDIRDVQLRFLVRDTGIGIPAAKQKEIFAAFTQADSSISREFGGTGLGLTICSQIVALMSGEIGVDSKLGIGSTFHFTARFGHASQPKSTTTSLAQYGPAVKGSRVLIVDDNESSLHNLRSMLAGTDAQVVGTSSAQTALAALQEADSAGAAFDMVIVDSDMPAINGFDLVQQVQARSNGKPAIMLLTSKNLNEHVARCRELGIIFLLKPVSPDRLLQTTADLLTARAKTMEKAAAPPPAAAPKYGIDALQILLAEDNLVNQKIVVEMLKKANCRVNAVANGAEAIASWKHQSYDLILMDMQMPRMDGPEATRRIREAERSGRTRIPILALTANAREEDRERCLSAGMDDYLSKPFKFEQLIEKIHRLAAATKA